MKIERIKFNQVAHKDEFMYLNSISHQTDEGDELIPVKEGVVYRIKYYYDKTENFVDYKKRPMFRLKNPTLLAQYKNTRVSSFRELYLKPYKLELNEKQKKASTITRAFAKQTNIKDGCIFEINPKSSGQKL